MSNQANCVSNCSPPVSLATHVKLTKYKVIILSLGESKSTQDSWTYVHLCASLPDQDHFTSVSPITACFLATHRKLTKWYTILLRPDESKSIRNWRIYVQFYVFMPDQANFVLVCRITACSSHLRLIEHRRGSRRCFKAQVESKLIRNWWTYVQFCVHPPGQANFIIMLACQDSNHSSPVSLAT